MSRTSRRIRRALGTALVLAAVLPAAASAQGTEYAYTYVDADVGSDGNECSFVAPCRSFVRAHDLTVAGGEIRVKSPGDYFALAITKPLTIDGSGHAATITPIGVFGVAVELSSGSGRVVLRDLRINAGPGNGAGGISVDRGGTVITDNVRILGGHEAGIKVSNNQGPLTKLVVEDTKIQGSAGPGIMIEPSGARAARATIHDTTIGDNGGTAIRLRPTAGAVARVTVRGSHLVNNLNGVVADSSGGGTAIANVIRTAITDSGLDPAGYGAGVLANGANATTRISRNEIQSNQRGLQSLNGGKVLTAGDNAIFGNVVNGAPTGTFGRQ